MCVYLIVVYEIFGILTAIFDFFSLERENKCLKITHFSKSNKFLSKYVPK